MKTPLSPNVTDLDRLYANRFSESERLAKSRLWKILCDSFLSRYIPPRSAVLDIGAGYCDFSNNIVASRRIAVDLNPDTVRHAAEGVEVHLLPLERLGEAASPNSLDVAFASNVFEHLRGPDSLLEILEAVRVALKPGGTLLILQPNARRVGMAFYDFVDHTLPLTEKGMAEALSMSGYEIIENRARFLPYTTKSRTPKTAFLLRLYLRFRPLQWLLGKQMFLVARKPAPSQPEDAVSRKDPS
jgi:SAM-dependent methyltransferase